MQEAVITTRADRLYVVVRRDLGIGLRTAQAGHALIEWTLANGAPPDNLVVLAVATLADLDRVAARLVGRVLLFREPDLDNELTAVAAGPECWRALSDLPLLR